MTASDSPSLIFAGIAGISSSSRDGLAGNHRKRAQGKNLNAGQHNKSLASVADRAWPDFEKAWRKQGDEPGDDNQRAPSQFGISVERRASQKRREQNAVADDQQSTGAGLLFARPRFKGEHAGDHEKRDRSHGREPRKPQQGNPVGLDCLHIHPRAARSAAHSAGVANLGEWPIMPGFGVRAVLRILVLMKRLSYPFNK